MEEDRTDASVPDSPVSLSSLDDRELEHLTELSSPYFSSHTEVGPPELKVVAERIDRDLRLLRSEAEEAGAPPSRGEGEDPRSRRVAGLAAGVGSLMVQELKLEWAASRTDESASSIEFVVRRPDTDIVFYPHRLVVRQLQQRTPMTVLALLDSTRRYLASLERFYPAST